MLNQYLTFRSVTNSAGIFADMSRHRFGVLNFVRYDFRLQSLGYKLHVATSSAQDNLLLFVMCYVRVFFCLFFLRFFSPFFFSFLFFFLCCLLMFTRFQFYLPFVLTIFFFLFSSKFSNGYFSTFL